jgi:hypothetical protein
MAAAVAIAAGGVGWWIARAEPAESRAAREAPDRRSLAGALEQTSLAVIARVLDLRDAGGDAELATVEILARMRGDAPTEPLRVVAPRGPRRGNDREGAYFAPGEVSLLLLRRDGERWTPVPGFRQAHVDLDPAPAGLEAVASLLRDYARAIDAGDDDERKATLKRGALIANPTIRSGVLFDLAPRLEREDSEFVRALLAPDHPDSVRTWAVHATSALEPESFPAELRARVASDPSIGVRQAALVACGARGDRRDLPVLRIGLRDPSPEVRIVAVQAFELPETVPVFRDHYTTESSPDVRRAILGQLGHLGTAEAVEALNEIREHETDESLREHAAMAQRAAESTAAAR